MKKLICLIALLLPAVAGVAQKELKTWTYGDHTYTMVGNLTAKEYKRTAKGTVTSHRNPIRWR